jgi:hypothetical protein
MGSYVCHVYITGYRKLKSVRLEIALGVIMLILDFHEIWPFASYSNVCMYTCTKLMSILFIFMKAT